jgi:hypothetical protein
MNTIIITITITMATTMALPGGDQKLCDREGAQQNHVRVEREVEGSAHLRLIG